MNNYTFKKIAHQLRTELKHFKLPIKVTLDNITDPPEIEIVFGDNVIWAMWNEDKAHWTTEVAVYPDGTNEETYSTCEEHRTADSLIEEIKEIITIECL